MKKTFILLSLSFLVIQLLAQPYTLDKNIKTTILRLIDYNGENGDTTWKGKVNITSVASKKDTMYFVVKGLSMYQPVYFSTTSNNKKIEVKLCKDTWRKADQNGTLSNNGKWSTRFKTEGSFGIMVINKEKAPYKLFTWVGKAIRAKDLPSPFKTKPNKPAVQTTKPTTKAAKTKTKNQKN